MNEPSLRIASTSQACSWLHDHFDASMTLRSWVGSAGECLLGPIPLARCLVGPWWGSEEVNVISTYFAEVGAIGAPTGLGMLMGAPVVLSMGTDEQSNGLFPLWQTELKVGVSSSANRVLAQILLRWRRGPNVTAMNGS